MSRSELRAVAILFVPMFIMCMCFVLSPRANADVTDDDGPATDRLLSTICVGMDEGLSIPQLLNTIESSGGYTAFQAGELVGKAVLTHCTWQAAAVRAYIAANAPETTA